MDSVYCLRFKNGRLLTWDDMRKDAGPRVYRTRHRPTAEMVLRRMDESYARSGLGDSGLEIVIRPRRAR